MFFSVVNLKRLPFATCLFVPSLCVLRVLVCVRKRLPDRSNRRYPVSTGFDSLIFKDFQKSFCFRNIVTIITQDAHIMRMLQVVLLQFF